MKNRQIFASSGSLAYVKRIMVGWKTGIFIDFELEDGYAVGIQSCIGSL
jgi:hypothetical protein